MRSTTGMISKRMLAAAGGLLLALASGGAMAADLGGARGGSIKDAAPAPEKRRCAFSANVALASEYVFRGFSQTGENPALQGGMDLVCDERFYIGFWGSNLDFGGRDASGSGLGPFKDVANLEIDWYAGVRHSLGRVDLDLGVIYYSYPGAFDSRLPLTSTSPLLEQRELDYVELKLAAKLKAHDNLTLSSTTYVSPEYTNKTGTVWTWEGGIERSLPKVAFISPTLSALLGWQIGDTDRYRSLIGNGSDNYLYWNAGVTLGFHEKLALDLRYWDTSIDNNALGKKQFGANNFCDGKANGGIFQCDERFVATLKATW